jgi:hypothetical protein
MSAAALSVTLARAVAAPRVAAKRHARVAGAVAPARCAAAASSSSSSSIDDASAASSSSSSSSSRAVDRRVVLLGGAALAATAAIAPDARAEGAETKRYVDAEDKYSFSVPADWEQAIGTTDDNPQSSRRVTAYFPPGDPDINVNVVCTALGADYPKMGSFGSPDEFAFGVAAGMTRPKPKSGPKQFSYVLNAKSKGDKYFIEYTVERPSEDFYQHLMSVVGVGYNGRVSRLITATAVCPEDKFAENKAKLEAILDTIELPPPLYS